MSQPNRIVVVKHEKKTIEPDTIRSVVNYFLVYLVIFITLVLIISLDFNDFESAFSTIASTFNNIGPGLGQVGPMGGYSGLSNWSKVLLSFVMIAGRLEIFPIIILFSSRTWRR